MATPELTEEQRLIALVDLIHACGALFGFGGTPPTLTADERRHWQMKYADACMTLFGGVPPHHTPDGAVATTIAA